MPTTTTTTTDLVTIVSALAPAAYFKAEGLDAPSRSERVAARRIVVHLWADLDAGRPCPEASRTIRMSDGSSLPFRLWAEGVLAIREGGRAYGVGVA